MEEAVLDYPLVEELDKIADKFAREDKGPQPAVTHSPSGDRRNAVATHGRYPTTRYGLVGAGAENRTQTSASPTSVHLRHPIIGDSKHGDLRQNGGGAEHFGLQRLMLHVMHVVIDASFYWRAADYSRRLDSTWMQALSQFGWRGLLPEMKGLSSVRHQVRWRDKFLIREKTVWRKLVFLSAPCAGNSLLVAEEAEAILTAQGHKATVFEDPELSDWLPYQDKYVLVVTSTTGQGDLPDSIVPLFQGIKIVWASSRICVMA